MMQIFTSHSHITATYKSFCLDLLCQSLIQQLHHTRRIPIVVRERLMVGFTVDYSFKFRYVFDHLFDKIERRSRCQSIHIGCTAHSFEDCDFVCEFSEYSNLSFVDVVGLGIDGFVSLSERSQSLGGWTVCENYLSARGSRRGSWRSVSMPARDHGDGGHCGGPSTQSCTASRWCSRILATR